MSLRPGTLSEHLKLDENFDASINSGATDSDDALRTANADNVYRQSDDEAGDDLDEDHKLPGDDFETPAASRRKFEENKKQIAAGEEDA